MSYHFYGSRKPSLKTQVAALLAITILTLEVRQFLPPFRQRRSRLRQEQSATASRKMGNLGCPTARSIVGGQRRPVADSLESRDDPDLKYRAHLNSSDPICRPRRRRRAKDKEDDASHECKARPCPRGDACVPLLHMQLGLLRRRAGAARARTRIIAERLSARPLSIWSRLSVCARARVHIADIHG